MVCGTRCFWFLVFAILNNGNILLDCKKLQRSKRFLIFPRQMPSRFSFIAGIGIPADLEYESLTVGYILRAQFYVPVNETVFRENPFYPEYKSEHNVTYDHHDQHHNYKRNYGLHSRASKMRWNLYTYIAERLNGYGYSGIECVLKAICEASALNFQRYNGVFEQIVHILLSPSSSIDKATPESVQYIEAEKFGRKTGDCGFYNCRISILDWISSVLKI